MKKGYKRKLLNVRIFLIFILVALALDFAIAGISYVMYTKNMNAEADRICAGISEAIASTMNGNRVDDWLNGKRLNDYEETGEQLLNLMNSYDDIVSVQVYKMNLDGARVIFDMTRNLKEIEKLGTTIEYNNRLSGAKAALIAGEYVGTIFTKQGVETIVTSLTPVTDTSNEVTCYAICEINMNTMQTNRMTFIKSLFITMLLISLLLVFIINVYLNYSVVSPLSKLDSTLRKMASDSTNAGEVRSELENFNSHGLNEIKSMCDNFIVMIDDISAKSDEADEYDKTAREKMNEAIKKSDI